jgi:prevent-host-death family protein
MKKKPSAKLKAAKPKPPTAISLKMQEAPVFSSEASGGETLPPEEVGAFDAKTHLASLLARVEGGQRFIITKRGRKIAELKPYGAPDKLPSLRKFGAGKGMVLYLSPDFDEPIEDFAEYMK